MEKSVWHVVPEEHWVAAVFIDLAGSSKLVAELRGQKLVEKLDPWFRTVATIFRAYGAEVVGRPGDCVVAGWLTPHISFIPDRAVLATLRARSASLEMGMKIHAGLHYGKSQVTTEKEPYSDLPTIFGEASWIAARVQSKDKNGDVLTTKELKEVTSIPIEWAAHSETLHELGRNWQLFRYDRTQLSTGGSATVICHWLEAECEARIGTAASVDLHCQNALQHLQALSDSKLLPVKERIEELLIDALVRQGKLGDCFDLCSNLLQRSDVTDKTRGRLWFELSDLFNAQGKYESARNALEKALQFGETIQSDRFKADCLFYLALTNEAMGQPKRHSNALMAEAEKKYSEFIVNPLSDPDETAKARLELSLIYRRTSKLKELIEQLREALKFFSIVSDFRNVGTALNSLGCVAMEKRLFSDAGSYFKRAFLKGREIGDQGLQNLSLGNLQKLRINRSRMPEMLLMSVPDSTYFDRDLPPPDMDDFDLGVWWHSRGRHYEKGADLDKALKCFLEGVRFKRAIAAEGLLANTLHMIGVIYAKRGRVSENAERHWENAERYFLESLWIEAEEGDLEGVKRSFHDFGTFLQDIGKPDEGASLYAATQSLINWENDQNPAHIDQASESLNSLPKNLLLRVHFLKAWETFTERWNIFRQFGS